MSLTRRAVLSAASLGLCRTVPAATTGPVDLTIVVPFPAGRSAFSVTARMLAEFLPTLMLRTVAIDNRPGASGTIGMSYLAAARPDGATIGMASVSTLAVLPGVRSTMVHYDPLTSFQPVALVAEAPVVLAVATSLEVGSFAQLRDRALAAPGRLNYASMGESGISDILMRLIARRSGMSVTNVPYQSPSAMLGDVGGGRVHIVLDQLAALQPLLSMKAVRPVAVMSMQRLPAFPDVPTAREIGLGALEATIWSGVVAPAGVADDKLSSLHREVQAFLASPQTIAGLNAMGFAPRPASRAFFAAFIDAELTVWRERAAALPKG